MIVAAASCSLQAAACIAAETAADCRRGVGPPRLDAVLLEFLGVAG